MARTAGLNGTHHRSPFARRLARIAMVMLMVLSPLLATHLPGVAAQETDVPSGNVIVILNDNVQLAETTAIAEDVDATVTFGTVLNGFAADLTPEEAAALADDPNVAGIYPDLPIYLAEEHTTSLGIRRVGAPAASVDLAQGLPAEVDATVAVLDTGVSVSHPNLDVVAGFDAWSAVQAGLGTTDCGALTPEQQAIYEGNGASTWGSTSNNPHGSMVAGVIGAKGLDAVTGMAPGANIVAVKVFDDSGSNLLSKVLCGLSWVQANKSVYGIDVVNMSFTWAVTATPCGAVEPDLGHEAICSVVNGGLPIVAANGNDGGAGPMNTYPELISVTGMNDYDGRPGGLAISQPGNCSSSQDDSADDTYATYNQAGGADYMAPGTCIRSTTTSTYGYNTGTSFAAPHVAGAVALYAASNPSPSDGAARAFLNSNSVPANDPDGIVSGDAAGSLMLRLGPSPIFDAIDPMSGAPSAYVDYTITGFPANSNVDITWEGIDGEIIDYPSVVSDSFGEARGQIQVPDKVPGGPGQLIHFTSGTLVTTFVFETRPRIRFQEPVAAPGSTVLANGRGFAAYDTLTVRWKNELGQYVTIGSVTTNSNGNFTNLALTVPSWAPAGVNTVRMEGVLNQNTSSLTVIVPDVQIVPTRTTVNNWITYDLSNFPPATSVSITWTRLSGGTIDMGSVMTDEAGNASGQFRVPATPGGPGQLITFEGGGVSDTVEFEVAPRIKSNTDPGERGGLVDISLRGFAKGESFIIRWRNTSSGQWITVGSGTLSNTGSANIWITVPHFAPDGLNSVRAESASFNQQTNVVNILGGAGFNPADENPVPTPEPTPDATATPEPTEPGTPPVIDSNALPFEAPLVIANITDDAQTPNLRTTLTDAQLSTTWSSAPDINRLDARLTIDLGGTYQVSGLAWLTEAIGCGKLVQVEYSTDGQTWTPIDPNLLPGDIASSLVWRFFGANVTATHLRITIGQAEPGQDPLGCIAEVKVWGTPVIAETPTPEPTATIEPTPVVETPTEVPTEEPAPAGDSAVPTETPEPESAG